VKILVVGGGGREHALVWKLAQSTRVERIWAAPGNPGMARHAACVPIDVDAHEALGALAEREAVDLVVVGPEVPLVAGLADRLRARGLVVFGPGARAARIEGSKAFAKALMARHAIPTAQFRTLDDPREARAYCRVLGAPVVVKADGLAAGKGAIVCRTLDEADAAVALCMESRAFGDAGQRVVVEEFLTGEEVSFFAVSNGKEAVALALAQDHKTVFDGDVGPNTGGMGAYVPVPFVDSALPARIMETIVRPTLAALAEEGALYRGVLFVGLMLTSSGPKVIEFNCRFGDPECQPIVAAMNGDIVPLLTAAARGEPLPSAVPAAERAAVCVALASGGYPGRYETGRPITGIEEAERLPGVHVFHAGTALHGDTLVTSGGRVLGVTAGAAGLGDAIAHAYEAIERIRFEGMHYRRDIGRRGEALAARDARSGRTA
jgi:phosphoribosylamine--glycine ligase